MSAPPPSELVARALKLRRQGLSYTAIGEACGVTKGAVAGMLFRAGACPRSTGHRASNSGKRKAKPPKPKVVLVPRAPPPPPPRRLEPGALRPGLTCSWPMWVDDTPRRERSYCGCATGGPGMSYCLIHWRKAYRPVGAVHA